MWIRCLLRIRSSTIRTPYFCKLFHYLFITFVFLFFLFWSKCQIHSCLAGVIIYGSKSSSEFFTPQNDEWIIIWHFWRVFDTLFLYYLLCCSLVWLLAGLALYPKRINIFLSYPFWITLELWKVTMIRAQCRLESCFI